MRADIARWIEIGLLMLAASTAQAQPLPFDLPNFCAAPTITATASGAWESAGTWTPARVPQANDIVSVPVGVSVSLNSQQDSSLSCVGVRGTLSWSTTTNTRLKAAELMVFSTGTLTIGTAASPIANGATAELIVADKAINNATDPEHYGTGVLILGGKFSVAGRTVTPTFSRLAGELAQGATTVSVADATNWQPNDTIIVPGTNQWFLDAETWAPQWEEVALSSISGASLRTGALAFAHSGAHDLDGTLRFLPHVGNLTRNVIVRSENPAGTRGHVLATGTADVDIRYALFKDLGRTTALPLDPATNTKGRYALHMHHLHGPQPTPADGYQFTLIGNVVRNATKWGITVHESHFGLVRDNIVYDAQGAGYMTEDGTETGNVFDHNFAVAVFGPGPDGTFNSKFQGGDERGDSRNVAVDIGYEGSGFWFRGPNNIIRNNVASDVNSYAFTLLVSQVGTVNIPAFKGADPMVNGVSVNMQATAIPEWVNNEGYAVANGMTIWDVGTNCCTEVYDAIGVSTILNQVTWNAGRRGYYGYAHNRVTFDGWKQRGQIYYFWSGFVYNLGFYWGDYIVRNLIVRNTDIQGLKTGIQLPFKVGDVTDVYGPNAPGTTLIENSTLDNEWDVSASPQYGVTGGGASLVPRLTTVRNVTFGAFPTTTPDGTPIDGAPCTVCMTFNPDPRNSNILVRDQMFVTAYNGTMGDDFQAFYAEQAPSFIVPQSNAGMLGAPVAGLTNAQLWAQRGLAIAGAVAPCATTRPLVQGFTCPSSMQTPTAPAAAGVAIVIP